MVTPGFWTGCSSVRTPGRILFQSWGASVLSARLRAQVAVLLPPLTFPQGVGWWINIMFISNIYCITGLLLLILSIYGLTIGVKKLLRCAFFPQP